MKKIVNARIVIKIEEIDNFILHAEEMVKNSKLETGCKIYKLFQEIGNSTSFIFYEEYESQTALDLHHSSPYLKNFINNIKEMLVEEPKIEVF